MGSRLAIAETYIRDDDLQQGHVAP
jgi:hypothetical protein